MSYPTPATTVEARIMKVLSEGEAYGAQIAKQSGGLIKKGTVYGALKRMEEQSWVKHRVEVVSPSGRGRCRKMYSLTEYGQDALDAYVQLIKRCMSLPYFAESEMAKGFLDVSA